MEIEYKENRVTTKQEMLWREKQGISTEWYNPSSSIRISL